MEVDKNVLIIKLVQGRPTLYAKGSDFRGRTVHWKEIATILKTDVPWVKSRWHLLRSKFLEEYITHLQGRRSTFRYFDDMSFLVEHVDMNAFKKLSKRNEFISHPEFVIEKKDLEDDSDDESNIFLELDLEEEQNKETEQIPQTFDLTEEVSQDCDDEPLYESNNLFSTNQPSVKVADSNSQEETILVEEEAEKEDSSTVCTQENAKNGSCQELTNESKTSSSNQDSENTTKEEETLQGPWPKQMKFQDEEKALQDNRATEKHRCEDAIFGELVAATLRKMNNEKKKSVKREIMNILFT